jgi:hypothetical protein
MVPASLVEAAESGVEIAVCTVPDGQSLIQRP